MELRHEVKHELVKRDLPEMRSRLSAVMQADPHAEGGKYLIRSLYFDNLYDKAYEEKINGAPRRAKFRVRYYNGDKSFICLEKKIKINGLGNKQQEQISIEQAERLSRGEPDWAGGDERPLVQELTTRMTTEGIMPKTIVDYTREPFIYSAGNVRVTLDYDVRTGLYCTDFLNLDCVTIPVPDDRVILEVKWDEFLPDIIRDIVQMPGRKEEAFSKYTVCRAYEFD